jgi:hypothetical protein
MKTKLLFPLALLALVLEFALQAKSPKPFDLEIRFSAQGVPLGSNVVVTASLSGAGVPGKGLAVAFADWKAETNVVSSPDASAVVALPSTKTADDPAAAGALSVRVLQNGEFTGRLVVERDGANVSRTVAVLAEDGRVWMALDSIENCEWTRITARFGVPEQDLTPDQRLLRDAEYQRKLEERRAKAAARAADGERQARQTAGPMAIAAGDRLTFTGQWQGPGSGGTSNFPIDGAKIVIHDLTNGTPDIAGFLVNGSFTFTAPVSNFQFTATLTSEFPGITAAGALATNGAPIGSFTVAKDNNNSPGPIYTVRVTNMLSYVSTEAVDGKPLSSMWAAFHGMAEMVRQAQAQLSVSKNTNFVILFESARISAYLGSSSKNIRILLDDRFDWDVVAHEFGHAIADEHMFLGVPAVGGSHDGSNQYDYASNTNTLNDKAKSLTLAFNEGFGTYFGASLLEKSAYKGRFKNVGDKKYDDTEDSNIHASMEDNAAPGSYGEDTENAIYNLFWDLYDSANEANSRTKPKIDGLADRTALGLGDLWKLMDGGQFANISDFWKKSYLPSGDIADFIKEGDNAIDGAKLRKALNAAETFAEFGMAPLLFSPAANTTIILVTNVGPTFKWDQVYTGNADLKLNKHRLAIYTQDLKTLLFLSPEQTDKTEYKLTAQDLTDIQDKLMNKSQASVVAVVIATSDTKMPTTGPYLSNGVELLLQNFNRAVVLVVDSSGSNTSTDPSNQRVAAAKESVRRLVSKADSAAGGVAPDLAAGIDFDSSVKVLSNFDDPDTVIPVFNAIDSSGGTRIDLGIRAGITLLDNINANGFRAFIGGKSAIMVFTDGQNGASDGDLSVIAAIVDATLKGIRVHYGFLSPFGSPIGLPTSGPGESETPFNPRGSVAQSATPSTIEEAVIASGGVYGVITDAESQLAFVNQVYARGLVNSDNADPGGGNLAGHITTSDSVTNAAQVRAFTFTGRAGEHVRVVVEADGFHPLLTVYGNDGSILAIDRDDDANGKIDLPLDLPYAGDYVAEVFSQDGRTGPFTVFVDVANIFNGVALTATGAVTLNRQTGLYEQIVEVQNTGTDSVEAVRIQIGGLPSSVKVYNASGTNQTGASFVQLNAPLAAGAKVSFKLEYYSGTRTAPAPVLTAEASSKIVPTDPTGTRFGISRLQVLADGSTLIEFAAEPGRTYVVEYSSDMTTWKAAVPAIVAGANRIQWIDSGPPKTDSAPGAGQSRFYRVVLLP